MKEKADVLLKGNKKKKIAFNVVAFGSIFWIFVTIIMYFQGLFDKLPKNYGDIFFVTSIIAFIIASLIAIQRNQLIIYEKGVVPSWLISINIKSNYISFDEVNKIIIKGVKRNYSLKIIMKDGKKGTIDRMDLNDDKWEKLISIFEIKSDKYGFQVVK
ncbi:MAG: hypothetical protein ACOC40_01250 [Thermoplasmatota archaeon]